MGVRVVWCVRRAVAGANAADALGRMDGRTDEIHVRREPKPKTKIRRKNHTKC